MGGELMGGGGVEEYIGEEYRAVNIGLGSIYS